MEAAVENAALRSGKSAVRQVTEPGEKERIAAQILHDLPEWFGQPESAQHYIKESRRMPFWAAYGAEEPGDCRQEHAVGFIALKETSRDTAEIFVMGVLKNWQRSGAGRELYEVFERYAREKGYSLVQVKTVRMGRYPEYDRTNRFYRAMGFLELECFPTLWDAANPCMVYVKPLNLECRRRTR
ncbi:MAG: GNAT family N-acetyltransferase [Lachnospiraceae bacterium]|nr:GNAT family N-acetyltransferase [Lachnospiraceae bacterium]